MKSMLRGTAFFALLGLAGIARADEACTQFKWDVSHEHALFQQAATAVTGGSEAGAAPAVKTETLYALTLVPQDGVHFAVPPRKTRDGAYAGLARLQVAQAGHYRVSLSAPVWVDVVQGGQVLPTADFGGSPGCVTPHKVVEFVLPAGQDLLLEFSGGDSAQVRFSVTAIAAH